MPEQFSTGVRGSGGQPISTTATGTMQTDNYDTGGAFEHDGSEYPYTLNPAATVQELLISRSADIVLGVTTIQGDTFDFPLAGTVGSFEGWEIDSVEFRDPKGTAAPIAGGWAGE